MAQQQIPSGLYSGGAVTLPQDPYRGYFIQALAQKQAKDEALGQYYQKMLTGINASGMRSQDVEGWTKKANDWQNYYMQNREQIKDPMKYGATAYNEFMNRYRDLEADADKSKREGETDKMIASKMLDPAWRQKATDQDLMIAQKRHASIYDPSFYKDGHTTPYGVEDFSFDAPEFDAKKQTDFLNATEHGYKRGKIYDEANGQINKNTQQVVIPYTETFGQDQLSKMAQRAGDLYDASKEAQSFFNNELHDPHTYDQLNKAYQSVYPGKNIMSGKDAAIGWTILNKQTPNVGQETRKWTDPNESLRKQEAFYDYRQRADQNKDEGSVEGYLQNIEKTAKKHPTPDTSLNNFLSNREEPVAYNVDVLPQLRSAFSRTNDKGHKVEPDAIKLLPNGDYRIEFFKKDENGIPQKAENGTSILSESMPPQTMSREVFKQTLAGKILTKRQAQKELPKPKKNDPLGILD